MNRPPSLLTGVQRGTRARAASPAAPPPSMTSACICRTSPACGPSGLGAAALQLALHLQVEPYAPSQPSSSGRSHGRCGREVETGPGAASRLGQYTRAGSTGRELRPGPGWAAGARSSRRAAAAALQRTARHLRAGTPAAPTRTRPGSSSPLLQQAAPGAAAAAAAAAAATTPAPGPGAASSGPAPGRSSTPAGRGAAPASQARGPLTRARAARRALALAAAPAPPRAAAATADSALTLIPRGALVPGAPLAPPPPHPIGALGLGDPRPDDPALVWWPPSPLLPRHVTNPGRPADRCSQLEKEPLREATGSRLVPALLGRASLARQPRRVLWRTRRSLRGPRPRMPPANDLYVLSSQWSSSFNLSLHPSWQAFLPLQNPLLPWIS